MKKRDPWFWYVARSNEIFLDLDSRRALNRALAVLRRAIARQFDLLPEFYYPYQNLLQVQSLWLYPTMTENHFHLIVVLKDDLRVETRLAWGLWMGADQIRAAYVMERFRHGFPLPDLLCSRRPYGFRSCDDRCDCTGKHKRKAATDKCPALGRMLGKHRSADYFPRNLDRKKRGPLRLEWGRISKTQLLKWK